MTMLVPPKIEQPIANLGDKNTIPNTNDPATGQLSLSLGFPPVTSVPISQGGVAPFREDFNGVLNLISQWLFFLQSGGMMKYDATLDYPKPSFVYMDDEVTGETIFFRCIQSNGPGYAVGPQDPTTSPDFWSQAYFGDVEVDGPGQGLHWAIAPTGTNWKQSQMPVAATNPGDWYTNHQDEGGTIIVGQGVQLPPGGTWLTSWCEAKSSMNQAGTGWDDSLGLTITKIVFNRPYAGGTIITPTDPQARIIMDAIRVL